MSLYTHRDSNIRKTWFLITVFLLLILTLGWVFGQIYQNQLIFIFVFALSLIMSVSSYWWSDKIVIMSTGAKPADENEYRELHRIIENLTITAGLPKPRVYIVESPQPNAFATGRNPKHAVVAVTTGLLNIMDRSELEGVLSHELSHVGNYDMLVSTVAVVLVGAIQLLSDIMIRSTFYGRANRDRNGGPAILMIIALILAIVAPIAGILMQLAISRKREFLADASGALLTRYPEGLARALEKLAKDHTPMRQANHATAHLWLDDPYQGKEKRMSFITKIFMTHPPIEDRIAKLRGLKV